MNFTFEKLDSGNASSELGKRLQETIKKRKFTQYEFAKRCGIAYETLRTHIKGYSYYRVDFLMRAAQILEVPYQYLLCDEDELPPEKEVTLNEQIVTATNLSKESVEKLTGTVKFPKHPISPEELECIDIIIKNVDILKSLTQYFQFTKNRVLNTNSLKEYTNTHSFSDDEIEMAYLYRMMKEISSNTRENIQD